MITNISDFISRTAEDNQIQSIPTYSSHATLAKRYVNECLLEHPEYTGFIKAIVSYPIQRWAAEAREKSQLDLNTLNETVRYEEGSFFGISGERFLKKQQHRLEITEKILEFIEQNVFSRADFYVLKVIHGYKCADVSKFIMSTHYKNQLLQACEENYRGFRPVSREIDRDYQLLDDDMQFVYHRTDLLLAMRPLLKKEYISSQVDYVKVSKMLDSCINCLESYYLGDPRIKKVVLLYSQKTKEEDIAAKLGKSRTYVRRMKREAVMALSYIVWGYFNV